MYCRIISACCIALLTVIASPLAGQSTDSLLYLLENDLVKGDSARYELLRKIISGTTDIRTKMQYCDQAIKLAEKMNKPAGAYILKGVCYLDCSDLASALDYFIRAANYYKPIDDNKGLARTYNYMAEVYNKQKNPEIERYYLRNAIEIYKEERDSVNLIKVLHNLGYSYYSNGQYDSAIIQYSTLSDIFLKRGNMTQYAYFIGNQGLAYSRLSNYDKAENLLLRALEILSIGKDEGAIIEFNIEYANILQQKGETEKAIACASASYKKALENSIKEYERDAAYRLAQLYSISDRYDSAFYYQSLYIGANDSIKNLETIQRMADLRTEFEVAQVQTEVDLLEKNKFFQRIIIIALAVILVLAIGIIMIYYSSLKRSRKLTAALDERRTLLEKQSSELKEKNEKIIKANEELRELYEITNNQKEEIISSINYAQRIQQAILPPETYITELINENFIFYKPKDIVSGDFYWIKQINQYIILVSADCTGHGVPGALMSMLGISYLNEIVQRKEVTQANQVLNELRKEIKHSLRQTGKKEESRDGIDMAICVIDTNRGIMQYSGAFCPLFIISNIKGKAELKEIEADQMPVGVHFSGDKSFTNHEIRLEIGDTFYVSTDGFIDQTGGKNNTRFGSRKFRELLLEIYDQPLFEQKDILQRRLSDWMKDNPQRDDILVIGARI